MKLFRNEKGFTGLEAAIAHWSKAGNEQHGNRWLHSGEREYHE